MTIRAICNKSPQYLFYIYLLTVLLTIGAQNVNAQESFNYTKFLETIHYVPEDSLAKFLYQKSGEFMVADSFVAANELLSHSIEYAHQFADTALIGWCKVRQGKVLNNLLEFHHSFIAFNKAFQISKQLHDTNMMLSAMHGIEEYYYKIELIDSATAYCIAAIHINKIKKNYVQLSDNYRALGSYQLNYADDNNGSFLFDNLMDSSLNAAYRANDPRYLVYAHTNYGNELYDRDPVRGLEYLQIAVDSARNLQVPSNALVYSLTKSSACYFSSHQFDKATTLLNEALPMAIKFKDTRQLTQIYYLLGNLHYKKDSINMALASYYKAIILAEKYKYKYYLPMIYKGLFDLYYNNELFDSSFVYQRKYMEAFKKENNKEMNHEIARLSAKFQVGQKVDAIDNLTIINNQRKIIIYNQKRFIVILAFVFILVSFLFLLLFKQYKRIKKAHLKLSQNALELIRKDREIAELRKKRNSQREDIYSELKSKLEVLFKHKKIYLKKDLTLAKTAQLLKTNTSYLSAIIHKDYNCKFNQFVNRYRIEEACELLSNSAMDVYSIEGIADMAGFNSKSVFNHVFKKTVGVQPSVFRESSSFAE